MSLRVSNAGARVAYLLAFFFVGVSLGPSLAHLLELPNKIGLDRDAYFIVQGIYSGWAWLGVVVLGALLATLALTIVLKGQRRAQRWAAAAFGCVVLAQIIFWAFTFPANQATSNWTEIPPEWEALRAQWEYSHAVAAIVNLIALLSLVFSVLEWRAAPAELPTAAARYPQQRHGQVRARKV
ncbi:MAG TPA: DUF1772 domain-containing protein [Gammaproteobacteria bacterium]